jgi:hypothetical protein
MDYHKRLEEIRPGHVFPYFCSYPLRLDMPVLLTAQNVDIVLGDPNPDRLYRAIPEIFEGLLEPNLDDFTRYTYCVSLFNRC